MDLISRKAVLDALGEPHPMDYNACSVVRLVKDIPAIDAALVKHGRWTTKRTQKHDGEWYCTVCDYVPIIMSDDMKYCPGCGAQMDLEG